jgi:membrane protein
MRKLIKLIQESAGTFTSARGTLMAGALAYYALFSIAPLFVLAITVATRVLGASGALETILQQISEFVTPEVAYSIRQMVESYVDNAFNTLPTIISLIVMLFAASIFFVQLKTAINQIWGIGSRPDKSVFLLARTHGLAFASVMTVGLLLVILTLTSTIINTISSFLFGEGSFLSETFLLWDFLFSVLALTLIFSLIFKVLPDAHISWRDVWLGSFVTAVAFTIGESLLGWYLGQTTIFSIYGVASSVLLILVWVFYSAQILLFGAAFTKAYADQYGSRIKPNSASFFIERKYNNQVDEPESRSSP